MKTLYAIIVAALLSSCHKELEPAAPVVNPVIVAPEAPVKKLSLGEFTSMLTKDKSYVITAYYNSEDSLSIPVVNIDDRYNFDMELSDGSVDSMEPCIEYHYIIRAYNNDNGILFDWLDFRIAPQTYTVYDYKVGEWFILKAGTTYTRYERVPKLRKS